MIPNLHSFHLLLHNPKAVKRFSQYLRNLIKKLNASYSNIYCLIKMACRKIIFCYSHVNTASLWWNRIQSRVQSNFKSFFTLKSTKFSMSRENDSILFTKALLRRFLSFVSRMTFLVFCWIWRQQLRISSSPESIGIICFSKEFSTALCPMKNESFWWKQSSMNVMERRASFATFSSRVLSRSSSCKTM